MRWQPGLLSCSQSLRHLRPDKLPTLQCARCAALSAAGHAAHAAAWPAGCDPSAAYACTSQLRLHIRRSWTWTWPPGLLLETVQAHQEQQPGCGRHSSDLPARTNASVLQPYLIRTGRLSIVCQRTCIHAASAHATWQAFTRELLFFCPSLAPSHACNLQWTAFTNVQPCDMRDALSGGSAVYVHDHHAILGFAVRLSLNLDGHVESVWAREARWWQAVNEQM